MNANQKGTALTGQALTDEVLASSDSVLAAGMYGQGRKGLQHFYTPEKAAALIARVMGDSVSVLDPTAGDTDAGRPALARRSQEQGTPPHNCVRL